MPLEFTSLALPKRTAAYNLEGTARKQSMTIHAPDILIYRGEHLSIWSFPLEPYFGEGNSRPGCVLSGLDRGYRATWEIDHDTLYLVDIEQAWVEGKALGLADLFPGHNGRVEASWFTGDVRIPLAPELAFSLGRRGNLIVAIENGKVVRSEFLEER
jgi:hypothetical protein